jgi:hypothetical protein
MGIGSQYDEAASLPRNINTIFDGRLRNWPLLAMQKWDFSILAFFAPAFYSINPRTSFQ